MFLVCVPPPPKRRAKWFFQNEGQFCLPRYIWYYLETFLFMTTGLGEIMRVVLLASSG